MTRKDTDMLVYFGKELEHYRQELMVIKATLAQHEARVAQAEVKASLLGILGGILPAVTLAAWWLVGKR